MGYQVRLSVKPWLRARRRLRVACLFLAALSLPALSGSARAGTTSISSAIPCTIVSCTQTTFHAEVYSISGSTLTIAPNCALTLGPACTAATQGNADYPPGFGPGATISVSTPTPGVIVELALCNNHSNSGTPIEHCPGTTRITIVVTTALGTTPGVTVSQVCAAVVGANPAPCTTYP